MSIEKCNINENIFLDKSKILIDKRLKGITT